MHILNTANQLRKESFGVLLLEVAMSQDVFKQLAACVYTVSETVVAYGWCTDTHLKRTRVWCQCISRSQPRCIVWQCTGDSMSIQSIWTVSMVCSSGHAIHTLSTDISLSTLLMRVSDPAPSFLISLMATYIMPPSLVVFGLSLWWICITSWPVSMWIPSLTLPNSPSPSVCSRL